MRLSQKSIAAALAAFGLAACGVATPQEPTPVPTPVLEIQPTPMSVVPFDQRLQASIGIDFPDDIAFAHGFIWVKTDDGHVIQVDPETNSVVGDIEVDTTSDRWHYCQGLGTDGTDVWACSASGDEDSKTIDVVRIDTVTQSVVATFNVRKVFEQHTMPFLLDHIWVLAEDGYKLVGLDTSTNQPAPTIDLGVRCIQVTATETTLLVSCLRDNLILVIDPLKGQITDRIVFPQPKNIVATATGIWVGQDPHVVRLDPETLVPVATFSGLGRDAGFSATTEAVWVRVEDGFVYRIDPQSNQLVEQISNDQQFTGGNILTTSDTLWVSVENNTLGLLLRFSIQ